MTEPHDHNAARWLVVRYLEAGRIARFGEFPAGWYVLRTCPCHFGHRVVRYPHDSAENARHAVAVMVLAAEVLKIDV